MGFWLSVGVGLWFGVGVWLGVWFGLWVGISWFCLMRFWVGIGWFWLWLIIMVFGSCVRPCRL